MKKITTEEKIGTLFAFVSCWVWLNWRVIKVKYNEGVSKWYDATVEAKDYTHLSAIICFNTNTWNGKNIDNYARLILHELCHIYTGAWSDVRDREKYVEQCVWEIPFALIHNRANDMEEQYTQYLDRLLFPFMLKDSNYKKLKKSLTSNNTKDD